MQQSGVFFVVVYQVGGVEIDGAHGILWEAVSVGSGIQVFPQEATYAASQFTKQVVGHQIFSFISQHSHLVVVNHAGYAQQIVKQA